MTKNKGTMLVLGGHGVFGTMIGAAAEAAGWTAIRTSRQPAAGFRHVDLAEPDTLEKVIDEADVIVSTVPDRQVVAERMVLDRGGLLVNVSAMAASSVAGLLREHERPRGTALMNAGIAPGLTNLLAAGLLGRHPEADEVELVFTVSLKGSHGPASGDIALEWLTAAKRHRTTVVRLPEPYGRRRCLGIAEQYGGWLGPVASGKTVSTYMCVTERGLHGALLAVNATGLIGRVAGSAAGSAPVPEATAEPVRHWVAVRRGGALLAARTLRCRGDYRSAAAATVLMAGRLTSRHDPLPAGLLVPEEVLTIDELEPGLDQAGITVVDEPAGDARSLARPGGVFAFPVGARPPVSSARYGALLGFDLVMRARNAVRRPPFVMYYLTGRLPGLRSDLTAAGFSVTAVPLTVLGPGADQASSGLLVLARKAA